MITFACGKPSPELKRLQEIQKDLASRFFRYCESNGLTTFLVAGSALGALRHEDVIPWDDDVDVGMLRSDFELLLKVYSSKPLEGLFLQSWLSEPGYPLAYAKLRIDGTYFGEPAFDGLGFHQGIFIDIFPFDDVPKSSLVTNIQRFMLEALGALLLSYNEANIERSQSRLRYTVRKLALFIHPFLPVRQLIKAREWICKWGNSETNSGADVISFHMYGVAKAEKTRLSQDVLVPPILHRFGDMMAPIPAQPEEYLTIKFGDWRQLPNPEQRRPGHVSHVDFGP